MKPLIILAVWFGPWPAWIEFFLETCKWNRDVNWLIVTDQPTPENAAANVRYQHMTLPAFWQLASSRIGIDLPETLPAYKLSDMKPAKGHILAEHTEGYHSYGYCDLDVFFGDIRHFYTDAMLRRFDLISSHAHIPAGHFSVFRNTPRVRESFRLIPGWREGIVQPEHVSLDETRYNKVFRSNSPLIHLYRSLRFRSHFEEQFSTVDWGNFWHDGTRTYPVAFYWQDGKLTSSTGGERQFLYLHVMKWATNRWRKDGNAPWPKLERIVRSDWREAGSAGFAISREGITRIEDAPAQPAR